MTVRELRERLEKVPDHYDVVVDVRMPGVLARRDCDLSVAAARVAVVRYGDGQANGFVITTETER